MIVCYAQNKEWGYGRERALRGVEEGRRGNRGGWDYGLRAIERVYVRPGEDTGRFGLAAVQEGVGGDTRRLCGCRPIERDRRQPGGKQYADTGRRRASKPGGPYCGV